MHDLYIIAGEYSGDFIGSRILRELKLLNNNIRPVSKLAEGLSIGVTQQMQSKLISKLADGVQMQGEHGTENRSVHAVREDLSTGATQQMPPSVEFTFAGIGGELMEQEGLTSLFPISKINMMGFLEILPHIFTLRRLIEDTVSDIIQKKPKVLITIDSPGFTYRVAKAVRLRDPSIKLVHVVAPSVWAYRAGRAKKYAALYDYLLTLLPFEPRYFTIYGLQSECIGHPVIEQDFLPRRTTSRDVKNIVVTPGSRVGEIKRHMPVIRAALDMLMQNYQIEATFVQPDLSRKELIESYLSGAQFVYNISTNKLAAFASGDCAIAKSGTNTLEIAASGTPMIVGYKLNPITFAILNRIIKVKYASLINIVARREIIPEFIQDRFTTFNVANTIRKLLSSSGAAELQMKLSREILTEIGFGSGAKPSAKAAQIIYERFLS